MTAKADNSDDARRKRMVDRTPIQCHASVGHFPLCRLYNNHIVTGFPGGCALKRDDPWEQLGILLDRGLELTQNAAPENPIRNADGVASLRMYDVCRMCIGDRVQFSGDTSSLPANSHLSHNSILRQPHVKHLRAKIEKAARDKQAAQRKPVEK